MKTAAKLSILGAALALAAVGTVGLVRMTRGRGAAQSADATASSPPPIVLRLPPGTSYRYRLGWRADTSTTVPGLAGDALHGHVDLAADLVLRSLGQKSGKTLVAVSLDRFGVHDLSVMGANALPDDAAVAATFAGREAYAEIDARGGVGDVYFKKGAPPLFESLVPTLLAELGLSLPDDARREWYAEESTSTGKSRTRYEVVPGALTTKLARTRTEYLSVFAAPACAGCSQGLASQGEVTIDPAGYLLAIRDDETLSLARASGEPAYLGKTSFVLTGPELGAFPVGTGVELDLASLEKRSVGQSARSRSVTRQLLEAQARGLTVARLESDLTFAGLLGRAPVDPAWPSRAAAILQLHPERCATLGDMFMRPGFTLTGRALLLDVLASAGTSEAQAAMRKALTSGAAREDPAAYPQLLQRLALVQAPDRDNAEILVDAYDAARRARAHDAEAASALSLGATVRGLAREGRFDDAREFNARLTGDLKAAETPEDKKMLLGALGNAAREENTKAIQAAASDASPDVRAEAARALRDSQSMEARATVIALAGDADGQVDQAAISALGQMPLSAGDLEALSGRVGAIEPSSAAATALVSLLGAHLDGGEPVRRMLEGVLAATRDSMEQARVRGMLDRMAGRPVL